MNERPLWCQMMFIKMNNSKKRETHNLLKAFSFIHRFIYWPFLFYPVNNLSSALCEGPDFFFMAVKEELNQKWWCITLSCPRAVCIIMNAGMLLTHRSFPHISHKDLIACRRRWELNTDKHKGDCKIDTWFHLFTSNTRKSDSLILNYLMFCNYTDNWCDASLNV